MSVDSVGTVVVCSAPLMSANAVVSSSLGLIMTVLVKLSRAPSPHSLSPLSSTPAQQPNFLWQYKRHFFTSLFVTASKMCPVEVQRDDTEVAWSLNVLTSASLSSISHILPVLIRVCNQDTISALMVAFTQFTSMHVYALYNTQKPICASNHDVSFLCG
jgi:hypothetical protein